MILIAKKLCNALIKDAEASSIVTFFSDQFDAPLPLETGLEVARKAMGGLWVGGNVHLFEDIVQFKPNKLNQFFHKGEVSWRIPLSKIAEVTTEFGFFTRIIRIKADGVTFKFRCYGARKFSEKILHQIQKVKRGENF